MTVVLLGVDGRSTRVLYHALTRRFDLGGIVLEPPVSRATLLRRRARRLGWPTVAGQVGFGLLVARPMSRSSEGRVQEILREHGLDDGPWPSSVHRVESVNGDACRALLTGLNPKVVVINGTRIISQTTLDAVSAPFVNMHAGITPRYRGVHGGYWALARGDLENVGVTVHYVDKGIDTGGVLRQAEIRPEPQDNFTTYPYLQLVAGLPKLLEVVEEVLAASPPSPVRPQVEDSKLWSHPTLGQYLFNRVFRNVR